ncbi:MAG: gamma-glutamyltransferase family protein [bacterium]|nr:gamma-glutamyltransferase family protein [bacterium]
MSDRFGRPPVNAAHGAVATSQPAAAEVGLQVLREGGNAVDAAIATAAALTVVEPCSNGIGSDAFALVWDGGRLHGINGSGRAPAALTAAKLRDAGRTEVPLHGWEAVTVPGAVAMWRDLHARMGRLPFQRLIEPAAALAEEGFEVTPVVARGWEAGVRRAPSAANGEVFAEFGRVFAPEGRAPRAGEIARLPDHAATLRAIAATGGEDFYHGELAETISNWAARSGGYLTAADLAAHTSQWVEPISANFRDHTVWEIPPSSQGIAVLAALTILDGLDPSDIDPTTTPGLHRAIEAVKLALTDAHRHVADPDHTPVPTAGLLDPAYAAARRDLIGATALTPTPGTPPGSETVYLCATDSEGQMVSFIQSNFHGFGSYVVVPGTGIALQNRGHGFSLEPGHPNELAPGKRPFHTIIPGFLTRTGREDGESGAAADGGGGASGAAAAGHTPIGPFGVMGGHMQAQGHVQFVLHTVDGGMDPQAALDQPRWHWHSGLDIQIEDRPWPQASAAQVTEELAARGHAATLAPADTVFGRGQAIWQTPHGYLGGTEPRADGEVAAY